MTGGGHAPDGSPLALCVRLSGQPEARLIAVRLRPLEAVDVGDPALEPPAGVHGFRVAGVFDPGRMLVRLEVAG